MKRQDDWDGVKVKALRRKLRATQADLAGEMGVRQQTVSDWETDVYRPRGASARLLSLIAEKADFEYGAAVQEKGADGS
ncbi:MAG: helix-turn-helix domain-containing protein [Chloroflexota bacterium]